MSGPVVLLALLSCFQIASALTRCDYNTDLITPFLADKENLYCFDDEGVNHVVDESSQLCSSGDFSPRTDGMDVRCASGYTLVGYSFYPCDTQTGVLATALVADDTLTQYSACVSDEVVADTVCTGVDSADAGNKLKVDSAYGNVANIDLVPENTTNYVSYAMTCDDGYGFLASETEPVYGYCSGNAEGNVFTITESDGCYEMCHPDNTNQEGITLAMEETSRSGATVSSEVVCPSGFEIAADAPEQYSWTCEGQKEGTANAGIYYCVDEDCPNCLAQCPANPTADQISNWADVPNLESVTNSAPAASGQTVLVGVSCGEGFSLAEGAEEQYDLQCNSNENNTEANSGTWTFVNDFPVCHPVCPENDFAAIENVDTVIIAAGIEGETVQGVVSCDSGHAMDVDMGIQYDFTCTNGQFVAAEDGPECQKECAVPEDNTEFIFMHKDEILEGGEIVPPGRSHIKLQCANDTLKLVGATTMSCNKEGELVHDDEEAPFCADTIICEAPEVENGKLDTRNNLEVDGVYTISCNPSHWFDTKTVKEYNAGDLSAEGYSETKVTCKGEPLPSFICYFGCLAPDFAGGATFPDMAEEGQAPYEMGAVVDFKCLDGASIADGEAQATCEVGGIGSPVCGACSFALSLFLSFALLLTLL